MSSNSSITVNDPELESALTVLSALVAVPAVIVAALTLALLVLFSPVLLVVQKLRGRRLMYGCACGCGRRIVHGEGA